VGEVCTSPHALAARATHSSAAEILILDMILVERGADDDAATA
jgi:hypothetical protein